MPFDFDDGDSNALACLLGNNEWTGDPNLPSSVGFLPRAIAVGESLLQGSDSSLSEDSAPSTGGKASLILTGSGEDQQSTTGALPPSDDLLKAPALQPTSEESTAERVKGKVREAHRAQSAMPTSTPHSSGEQLVGVGNPFSFTFPATRAFSGNGAPQEAESPHIDLRNLPFPDPGNYPVPPANAPLAGPSAKRKNREEKNYQCPLCRKW
jgi:hypothetical protein